MTIARRLALLFLIVVSLSSLVPGLLTSSSYETQHRRNSNERPGRTFLLGADDLGRDRCARLLYGTRTSLLLGPAAAFLATGIAALLGVAAAYFAQIRRPIFYIADILMSTPLLFLLLIVRALLPLDLPAWASICATFALLGLLGWVPGVRVFEAATQDLINSDFILQARANGASPIRLVVTQCLPNLMPAVFAQFCVFVPVFVLAEANLSMLGLGVSEPLPSLGNLMSDLLNYSAVMEQPWLLVPAVLLFGIIGSLQLLVPKVS